MNGVRIRRALINLILGTIPGTIIGKVSNVDMSDYTCTVSPIDGGPDYQNVRLKGAIDSDDAGMVIIPEDNSTVVITPIQNNKHNYYITRYTKVKKYIIKMVGGGKFEMNENGEIKLNDASLGGIPKASVLATEINSIKQDLSTLKNLIGVVWIPVPNDGGAALKTAAATWAAAALTSTSQSAIENAKCKHGV